MSDPKRCGGAHNDLGQLVAGSFTDTKKDDDFEVEGSTITCLFGRAVLGRPFRFSGCAL
jgi:hypothetical protein